MRMSCECEQKIRAALWTGRAVTLHFRKLKAKTVTWGSLGSLGSKCPAVVIQHDPK